MSRHFDTDDHYSRWLINKLATYGVELVDGYGLGPPAVYCPYTRTLWVARHLSEVCSYVLDAVFSAYMGPTTPLWHFTHPAPDKIKPFTSRYALVPHPDKW